MKTKEIRQLSAQELDTELTRLRRHLFDLRAQAVTEKLENPRLITQAKRDVARCLTVQREQSQKQ